MEFSASFSIAVPLILVLIGVTMTTGKASTIYSCQCYSQLCDQFGSCGGPCSTETTAQRTCPKTAKKRSWRAIVSDNAKQFVNEGNAKTCKSLPENEEVKVNFEPGTVFYYMVLALKEQNKSPKNTKLSLDGHPAMYTVHSDNYKEYILRAIGVKKVHNVSVSNLPSDLCSIKIYGDWVCQQGWTGLHCPWVCTSDCMSNNTCDPIFGFCSQPNMAAVEQDSSIDYASSLLAVALGLGPVFLVCLICTIVFTSLRAKIRRLRTVEFRKNWKKNSELRRDSRRLSRVSGAGIVGPERVSLQLGVAGVKQTSSASMVVTQEQLGGTEE